ncbi:MAG: T9SS type A sorting domain-containing protein [Bacteroidota bacterium]
MFTRRVISVGTSFLFLSILLTTTLQAQLYTKLQWMPEDNLWGVFVKTDSTVQPSQNILLGSGQVTVVAPTGFVIENMTSYMGAWSQNARANQPIENTEKDYISFGIRISEPITELGRFGETLILTFSTTADACPSSLYLIEDDDPFVSESPNSLNTNPGNDLQMVDLGNAGSIYRYMGNYDLDSWDCRSTNITTSLKDFDRPQLIKVFPNPFREELVFELVDRSQRMDLQIELHDNIGRTILTQPMTDSRMTINVAEGDALYFYKITNAKTKQLIDSGKLIKRSTK